MNYILRLGMILASFIGVIARGEAQEIWRVDMGAYTILTDCDNPRKVGKWVEKFNEQQKVAQHLIGVEDHELQALTLLLFEKDRDFQKFIDRKPTDLSGQTEGKFTLVSVGMGRRPMVVLSMQSGGSSVDKKIRGAVMYWLLSASGDNFDHWIGQGFLHMLQESYHSRGTIKIGHLNQFNLEALDDYSRRKFSPKQKSAALAWARVHDLLIEDKQWQGFSKLREYQSLVGAEVEREVAFRKVFGMSLTEFDARIEKKIHRRAFGAVKVKLEGIEDDLEISHERAAPGVWPLHLALFFVQDRNGEEAQIQGYLQRGESLIDPANPIGAEVRWLHALRTHQDNLAKTALREAIEKGVSNNIMRLIWCQDLIAEGIDHHRALIVEPGDARLAADILAKVVASQSPQLSTYRLLASLLPSIPSARPQDRVLLEKGISKYPDDLVLQVGRAAWYWRNGDSRMAAETLRDSAALAGNSEFAQRYRIWLANQMNTGVRLAQMRESLDLGDLQGAASRYQLIDLQVPYLPDVQSDIEFSKRELDQRNFLQRVQVKVTEGDLETARLMLREVDADTLSDSVRIKYRKLSEAIESL